jgi:tetrahydromethanopterin S-methyltransferase subunit G
MVSDEELKQHIRTAERQHEQSTPVAGRLDEMESTARHVHNELARRIEAVDDASADRDELAAIREELARLDRRLESIEAQLD